MALPVTKKKTSTTTRVISRVCSYLLVVVGDTLLVVVDSGTLVFCSSGCSRTDRTIRVPDSTFCVVKVYPLLAHHYHLGPFVVLCIVVVDIYR